ncbi:MAG: hypothetical protein ACO2O2_00985 [Acidilobaceae archaeon]
MELELCDVVELASIGLALTALLITLATLLKPRLTRLLRRSG